MIRRIIKIVSILIVAFIAILGVMFELRDKTGILTDWGFIAIIAAMLSVLSAIIIEVIEYAKEVREARAASVLEELHQKQLDEIRNNISNKDYPLVPFRLFYTIKHTTSDEQVSKYFSNQKGFGSVQKNEFLKFVGTAIIGEIFYNPEEETPEYSHCVLQDPEIIDSALQAAGYGNTVIKRPFEFVIEVTMSGSTEPDIVFEAAKDGSGAINTAVSELRLYDNYIYQDGITPSWKIRKRNNKSFSTKDLQSAKLRVIIDFFNVGVEDSPKLTNLHLYFGENPTTFIYFQLADLFNQHSRRRNPLEVIMKLEGDLANEVFQTLATEINIVINDEVFNNQIRHYT